MKKVLTIRFEIISDNEKAKPTKIEQLSLVIIVLLKLSNRNYCLLKSGMP